MWKGASPTTPFMRCARSRARRSAAPRKPAADAARSAAAAWRRRPPKDAGRCSPIASPRVSTDTQWSTAMAQQLLARYGVVTREVAAAEGIAGGFGAVYDVLKALEEPAACGAATSSAASARRSSRCRPALELLRSLRERPRRRGRSCSRPPIRPIRTATTLKWPAGAVGRRSRARGRGPTRTVGALVVLVNGALAAYIPRGGRQIIVYLPDDEPARSTIGRALARALSRRSPATKPAAACSSPRSTARPPAEHPLAPFLDRGRLPPVGHGIPDAIAAPAAVAPADVERRRPRDRCLKATRSSARRARSHRALAGQGVVALRVRPARADARPRRHADHRPHGRARRRRRQARADAVLRRPRAAHAHAHERQLAHLSRRASAGSAPRRDMRIVVATDDVRGGRLQRAGRGVPRRTASCSASEDLRRHRAPTCSARRSTQGEAVRHVLASGRRRRSPTRCSTSASSPASATSTSRRCSFICGVNPFAPGRGRDRRRSFVRSSAAGQKYSARTCRPRRERCTTYTGYQTDDGPRSIRASDCTSTAARGSRAGSAARQSGSGAGPRRAA